MTAFPHSPPDPPSPTPIFAGELGSQLQAWMVAWRFPILDSEDPTTRFLIRAARRLSPVTFLYFGGSEPGSTRRVTPSLVFEVAGFPGTYLAGICHRRRDLRCFNIDRILLLEG